MVSERSAFGGKEGRFSEDRVYWVDGEEKRLYRGDFKGIKDNG